MKAKCAYNREWRKNNPQYMRDYMRMRRGSRAGVIGRWPNRKRILGVSVDVNILRKLLLAESTKRAL